MALSLWAVPWGHPSQGGVQSLSLWGPWHPKGANPFRAQPVPHLARGAHRGRGRDREPRRLWVARPIPGDHVADTTTK